ncbi:MAG: hypothetical protein LC750_10940 [Actinobacteria bacterium]|nr:hypothetical protein [Actinomycetota bacterium]
MIVPGTGDNALRTTAGVIILVALAACGGSGKKVATAPTVSPAVACRLFAALRADLVVKALRPKEIPIRMEAEVLPAARSAKDPIVTPAVSRVNSALQKAVTFTDKGSTYADESMTTYWTVGEEMIEDGMRWGDRSHFEPLQMGDEGSATEELQQSVAALWRACDAVGENIAP